MAPLSRLSKFLTTAEELRYPVASLTFTGPNEDDHIMSIVVVGSERTAHQFPPDAPFHILFRCRRIDEQVVCAAQICTAMSPMLAEVERLHLNSHLMHGMTGLPPDIPHLVWFAPLQPFCNVLKLQLDTAMTYMLSSALCEGEGTLANQLLPILPKLCKLSRPHQTRFEGMLDHVFRLPARRGTAHCQAPPSFRLGCQKRRVVTCQRLRRRELHRA
jgi:hypothetical protein